MDDITFYIKKEVIEMNKKTQKMVSVIIVAVVILAMIVPLFVSAF